MEKTKPFYTYDELVLLAEKAVDKRGYGYIYPSADARATNKADFSFGSASTDQHSPGACVYMFAENQPGCVVGEMLYTANLITEIPKWNESSGIDELLEEDQAPFTTTNKGSFFLGRLQSLQDRSRPWGIAVGLAMEITEQYHPGEETA